MKNLSLIITILVLFIGCQKDEARTDIVEIPDVNFLNALIEVGVDSDGDGKISFSEASVIVTLNLREKEISSLSGLEAFENLQSINCINNNLENINVTQNIKITTLYCGGNPITQIDVSKNPSLKSFQCGNSMWSNNVHQLSSIDFTKNPELEDLYVSGNQLVNLDLSENRSLKELYCGLNNLSNLDISKNIDLSIIAINHMPNLSKVCVWTLPFPPPIVEVDTTESSNVVFSTICSK